MGRKNKTDYGDRMSFYNMFFGVNEKAPVLLKCLGFSEDDIPRFRDCYIKNNSIAIYTRTGGGNRDYYENAETRIKNYPEDFKDGKTPTPPFNDDLRKHPNYIDDYDDSYDCTYATFIFSFPDEYKNELKALAENNTEYTPSEKWKILLDSLEDKK